MKYVIIGNSAAAIGCIEGIRQVDKKGEITVISDEPHHTYSRPLISYLLLGKTDEQKMKYRPDNFYEENGVTPILGVRVTKIDKDKKQVILSNDKVIPYDKLMVSTGSKPFVPPMKGLDTVKYHTFMSLNDAKALGKELGKDKKVLIVGAGLIGLKCAEGILEKVKSITVVDLADRILPSILDVKGSEIVKKFLKKKGIKFYLSDSVAEFTPNKATLASGNVLDFDILVIAVGVRPNVELIQEAGGDVSRGIVTNLDSSTSLKDIYAAGDCTTCFDSVTCEQRILALLPNAYMQGECAGINMAGGSNQFEKAMPMNAIGFFGLHIITAGSYVGEECVETKEDVYKKFVTKDNLLKGYILIGDVERAGIYTSLIREKTPLDTIDFELIKEKPQLMAFSKVERSKKLGGAK
ncbi:MAG: FAD-dependent oxidoreductase [Eubacteriales bacterium]